MEGYRLIGEETASKLRMTPEEAEAVAQLWAVQNRLTFPGSPLPNTIPPGLVIPPEDVRAYLRELRGETKRRFRPARSLGADVRLAIIGAAVLVMAAVGLTMMFNSNRPFRVGRPTARAIHQTTVGNMSRTEYRFPNFDYWLPVWSSAPVRYIFARGNYSFEPMGEPIPARLDNVRTALRSVIGGPLASNSSVPTRPLNEEAVRRAFESRPQRSDPWGSSSGGFGMSPLIQWETVYAAYGGQVVQAWVPYARVSDRALRLAVEKEQERVLAELAESALTLADPAMPAEAPTPTPSAR